MATPPGLDEIGLRHGTDKASSHHDYLSHYESFLAPLRDQPITFMEIGVFQGSSLRTWKDYFPNAAIVGVDIMPVCKRFENGRVRIELADQSNVEHLAQVALRRGPFDVIVEDGSHIWDHQITSLRTLFPFVKNGGFYIIEDLQTNYGAMLTKYKGAASESCVEFLKRWMDLCVADEEIDLRGVEDSFLRTYGRSIEYMSFHRRSCVIKKKFTPTDWRVTAGPALAPVPPDAAVVLITAHVGIRGDILGPNGFVDEGSDTYTIQGFALQSDAGALEYRVRYPEGTWSEWALEGQFAGTRGLSLPITGFSVRLRNGAAEKFSLRSYARFVADKFAEADAGEDCVSPDGEKLRGLQFVLTPRLA